MLTILFNWNRGTVILPPGLEDIPRSLSLSRGVDLELSIQRDADFELTAITPETN